MVCSKILIEKQGRQLAQFSPSLSAWSKERCAGAMRPCLDQPEGPLSSRWLIAPESAEASASHQVPVHQPAQPIRSHHP